MTRKRIISIHIYTSQQREWTKSRGRLPFLRYESDACGRFWEERSGQDNICATYGGAQVSRPALWRSNTSVLSICKLQRLSHLPPPASQRLAEPLQCQEVGRHAFTGRVHLSLLLKSDMLTLTTLCDTDATEGQRSDKWPFHPGVTETSLWFLESCSPLRFSQRVLPFSWLPINRLMSASLFCKTLFHLKAAWPYHFWMALHHVLYSVSNTHRLMLIPSQLTIQQLFSCLIGRLAQSTRSLLSACISSAWEIRSLACSF